MVIKSGILASASAAVLLLAAGAAVAQEAQVGQAVDAADASTVEGVTVLATRTEKSVEVAPATVSVISDEEIADQLATDIKGLVRYEPGVSVRTAPARFGAALGTAGRDGNSGFNIRGLEGNRVLILLDGVRAPDAFSFGAQSTGRGDYADLELMKRVEILRGPGSALYGSDGVAGVVAFTTKDPEDFLRGGRDFGVQGKLGYGSADEGSAAGLVVAGRTGGFSGMLAYSRREASETETQGTNNSLTSARTAANPQSIQSDSWLGKLVFEPAEGHRIRLTGETFEREVVTDVLSGRSASVLDLDGRDTTQRDRVSVDYRYSGEGVLRSAFVAAWWQDATTVQFSDEDRNPAADRTRLNTFDNRVIGLSAEAETRFATGGIEHRLVFGADVSVTRQEGVRDGTVPPTGEVFPTRAFPNTDYTLAGVFVQDEISLMDGRLTLYPALRYDYYELSPETDPLLVGFIPADQSDGRFSPKLGATFDIGGGWSLFANYAEGFKAPSPSQLNNSFGNIIFNYASIPNPDLKPETSRTFEGGLRWRSEGMFAGITVFTGRYDDFIEQILVGGTFTPGDPGLYQYRNIGEVEISGIEFRGRARLGGGFYVDGAMAWAEGDATSGGVTVPLDSIDPFKATVGLGWRDSAGRFGGQVHITHSAGKEEDRIGTACAPACFTPGDFTLVDLTAYWNINEAVTVRGGLFNVTDEKYWWWSDVRGLSSTSPTLDAYTQPGRNFGVSLTLRY
jgi:hemoglobin/transferrin/lactoferrin receptor protein